MIRNFRSKALEALFLTGESRKVQPRHLRRLKLILSMLNVATHAGQLNAPGLRLHLLEPKKAGRYAVWVDENYRVTFEFVGIDIEGIDYEDYH